jgi:hypothetical protein
MDFLPIIGSMTGVAAFLFTFRKDAHHVRLELQYDGHQKYVSKAVLNINNDSACTFGVLSIGHFDEAGQITWLERVGKYATNRYVDYPIRIEPRSMCAILLVVGRDIPSPKTRTGVCLQLETGRVYVLRNRAPVLVWLRMYAGSIVSRLSRGGWSPGIASRPRVPSRDEG